MSVAVLKGKDFDSRDVLRRSGHADNPTAENTLKTCLHRSIEVRYGKLADGTVVCVWGLIPPTVLSDSAYLWLITTDLVAENKFIFVRHSQRYIEEALAIYPTIVGEVFVDNHPAQRWLRWLGAEFQSPVDGKIPFVIKAKNG
jgi:hypothetical protein